MEEQLEREDHPVLIWSFSYPNTKKLALHEIFRTQDAVSKENLSKTTSARDEFLAALSAGHASNVLLTAERYLPQLFGLVVSVEENSNLRLNSPLNFAWSSAFDKKPHYTTCYTYRYEAIMAVLAYAFAHINKAGELIVSSRDETLEEDSKKAAQLLRTAAGIFEYVCTRELPCWLDQPKEKPLEITLDVTKVLQEYCCATAQAITLKKALKSGGTSKLVMAKLAIDVWKKNEQIAKVFKGLSEYKDLNSNFKTFLTTLVSISKACAFKYLGQNVHEQEKYGHAVAYLNVASGALKQVSVPNPSSSLSKYSAAIESTRDHIEHVKRSFTNENNHIHYQTVVQENSLEVPEPKTLMTPLGWMPPQPAYSELH